MRKEQFRWKIGTAPAWEEAGAGQKPQSVERGSVKKVRAAGAMTCHSCPEAKRGVAGITGMRLSDDRLQQVGVAQPMRAALQHVQVCGKPERVGPAIAKPLCQPAMIGKI